ncbi:MAG: acyltransferase domain-containing protein [Rhodobacteraceae bacterium]|nr:MAG: acyltransferase domain-containing protein [Paracoccaceae bacterium]
MNASEHPFAERGDIAVVGMAVRVPGANDIGTFWSNLRSGLSAIRELDADALAAAGVPESLSRRPDYVPFAAPLDGFADFDAEFFGLSPKEAAVMDPQHRQFLEVAWEAMEHAGHPPVSVGGNVGVYAGCGMGSYFYFNVCSHRDLVADTGMFLLRHTGNDKDFMSTRLSHILDLSGPSLGLQTACSTSLVAIHYAAQALNAGDCDMALAGGVTIELPQGHGYLFKENEILSPDGTCRAFDADAAGTVFGSGAGVVVLRRLSDAITDGDHIWAVLKGSAVNNDGADKASYLAPSVGGQATAITRAQAAAGIGADSIGYVECHGTGTYLGDPIEVAALTDAFRHSTDAAGFCRIGSVKTNIGHLDTAAGVASFVKATLALHNQAIPPSLNFDRPNPAIDFDGSPFRVNSEITPWPRTDAPRRAGVNSLGVGGTNAHAVLEEAPDRTPSEASDWPFQPLVLSARTRGALDAATENLAAHLDRADQPLADIAFTLKDGRHAFDRRRVVVAESHAEAAQLLRANDPRRVFTHTKVADEPEPVFMFPGGGAQYAGMARDLYETEPVFRDWMDKGLAILEPQVDFDIRALWLPEPGDEAAANDRLQAPSVQLPLIAITEYALAQLWISWGVTPTTLIGHSMGENTAACLAGVMSLEDCINLVLLRGRLFETVETGGMLSVPLSGDALRDRLPDDLDIASINAPGLSVVSGTRAALDRFAEALAKDDIDTRRIQIDIAAHSRLLDPILTHFGDFLHTLDLKPPTIPIVSNRTGDWLTDDQATDPDYWVAHLRNTIRFRDGLSTLAAKRERLYIEVGPGTALASLAGAHDKIDTNQVIGTLRHPDDPIADDLHFVGMLARVWATGGRIDWDQIWAGARRNRVPLPTYPFQHSRYFIEPADTAGEAEDVWLTRIEDRDEWAWRPVWKPAYADVEPDALATASPRTWLIFEDDTGLGADLARRLRKAGHTVTSVRPGDAFSRIDDQTYTLAVERGQDSFDSLLGDLKARDRLPTRLAHLWLVTGKETARPGSSFFHRVQEQGFWSLFHFARAWAGADGGDLALTVVTSEAARVGTETLRYPEKATVAGPARVIPGEFSGITCATLDIAAPQRGAHPATDAVLDECLAVPGNSIAAVRGDKRYEQHWTRADLPAPDAFRIAPDSVILLTGGLGGIGLTLAETLTRDRLARVAIISRTPLPDRDQWQRIIDLAPDTDRLARRLRRLTALEEAGATVEIVTADVSNVEDMRAALDDIRATLGPVSGVIHAAGVIDDGLILAKDEIGIEDLFTPKIHGTQVLTGLFGKDELDWMALFSSSSTVTAPAGQVDYVAANEYLNAVALARQDGRTRVRVIDWGPWAEVGMAADATLGTTDTAPGDAVAEPLLDDMATQPDGSAVFRANWSPDRHWVLDQHRTRAGDALLPGTGYIELAAEALAAAGQGDGPFRIDGLTFLSPLRAPDDTKTSVRVDLDRTAQGHAFRVRSGPPDAMDTHAEATLHPLAETDPRTIDIAAIRERLAPPGAGAPPLPQDRHLALGPRWQVARTLATGENEALADLARAGDADYRLDPGLLDTATGLGLPLIDGYDPSQFWVPLSYGKIDVLGPIPAQAVGWIESDPANSASADTARFDITIAAPDGRVAVRIEDFTMHRLARGIDFASAPATPRPLSPAEERLRHMVAQGIPPADGATMFLRAMASDLPQVLVSSLDLPAMIAQTRADSAPRPDPEAGFERPDLDSDFAPPETAVERQLAAYWSELLGIEEIGIDDSFFDLGGHSLIAVRLFAKIKSTYSVDFPISVLFEAPTIRTCAALIAERVGDSGPTDEAGATDAAATKPDHLHVVPMNVGNAAKTPFFMVAGMFGNILNLRHLAHLIDPNRAFYGLQARGLYGGVDPHDDLVEAARDYIAEMRQVQPQGPYMVGGFSGGGITAYEIARQLDAAGENVSALIFLDTPLPQRRTLSRRDRMMLQLLKFREEGLTYPVTWARRRIAWEIEKRKAAPFETHDSEFHNATIRAAFEQAIAAYHVEPANAPVTLFRPPLSTRYEVAPGRFVNQDREYLDPANDWDRHVEDLTVIEVPGDHDSMVLEPNVRVLAARMRAVLDKAETARTTGPSPDLKAAE